MQVRELLRNIRLNLCLTQREFANLLGVCQATLCFYEKGLREPSLKTIRKIVDILKQQNINLSYADFISDKNKINISDEVKPNE